MCLVLGHILGRCTNSRAPLLSSKTVQCILGGKSSMLTPCARASVRSPISGITSLRLEESAMYSASVVDMAVMVCILDAQVMGAPAKRTIHPKRDLAVIGSLCASAWRQFPAKSASTQQSNCLDLLGCMIMPLSCVASRYRPIRFTASVWIFLGASEKRVHWWMLTEMSGLVDFSRKFSFPITLRQWNSGCMLGPSVSLCNSVEVTAGVILCLESGCKCKSLMMESMRCGCDR